MPGRVHQPLGGHFRPDIEGLRAIAVLAVVAGHTSSRFFPGGYVGVDVFFVISGFLITGLLIRELRTTGTIDFANFYARRVRRLLPAGAVVLVVTVIAVVVLLSPLRATEAAVDARWAAMFSSNIRFAANGTDYFAVNRPVSPLQHFWSLAVEEQFYLVWPATLFLMTRRARRRGALNLRVVGALIVVLSGASLAYGVHLTDTSPTDAYFLMTTRAWELGVGAALAVVAARLDRLRSRDADVLFVLGGVAVGAAILLYDGHTPFPGYAALLPVIGAALLIAGGVNSRVAKLLDVAPLQWVGARSYSLYLWHWPVLIVAAAYAQRALRPRESVVAVGAAFVLAAASYAIVEAPIRESRWLRRRHLASLGVGAALTAAAVGVSSAVVAASPGTPSFVNRGEVAAAAGQTTEQTLTDQINAALAGDVARAVIPAPAVARAEQTALFESGCYVGVSATRQRGRCLFGDKSADRTIMLVGDSHAAMWFSAVDLWAKRNHYRLVTLAKLACPANRAGVLQSITRDAYPECDAFHRYVRQRVRRDQPEIVLVTSARQYQLPDTRYGGAEFRRRWRDGLAAFLRDVAAPGRHLVVLGDTPDPRTDVPECIATNRDNLRACAFVPVDTSQIAAAERAAAEMQDASYIDPTPWFCGADACPVVIGRRIVYRDGGHVSDTYATYVGPVFAAHLSGTLPP